MVVAGALVYGAVQLASNIINDRPALDGVGSQLAVGAAAGLTLGTSALLGGATTAGTSGAAQTVTQSAVPAATNPALRNTLGQLFRASDRFPGGTAGAIRHELATGELVGGKSHVQKGLERVANLERIIRHEKLSAEDLATARAVLQDLKDALAGK